MLRHHFDHCQPKCVLVKCLSTKWQGHSCVDQMSVGQMVFEQNARHREKETSTDLESVEL
jgi:hypothetical protein